MTPWSLCFMLMLLSQPIRTADAGPAWDQRFRTKTHSAPINKLASLTPASAYDQRKQQQRGRQKAPAKQKTSSASLLAARDLRSHNTHLHKPTSQQVVFCPLPSRTGDIRSPFWAMCQASRFFGACHPLPTWGCPLCWLYSCCSNGAACPHKQPPLQIF